MGWLKKAVNKVKGVANKQLVQRVGALVAPVALLPGLINKGYRKNTGPIYAAYGAVGAGALGAAAAGLGSGAIVAGGLAGGAPLGTSIIGGLTGGSSRSTSSTTNADNFFTAPQGDTGEAGGGGGDSGSAGGFFGSNGSGTPSWLYGIAAALVAVLAVLMFKRMRK